MNKSRLAFVIAFTFLLTCSGASAQAPSAPPAQGAAPADPMDPVVDRIIERENALVQAFANYSPLVETYIQNLAPDPVLGAVPKNDTYFLGKLDLTKGVTGRPLTAAPGFGSAFKNAITQIYSIRYLADGFAKLILVDGKNFSRDQYDFKYVRKEFLGEVRCLVFDVQPKARTGDGKFFGRIWVEEKDYTIVRFNGAYGTSDSSKKYFHFDSWRQKMGPGYWLPVYVYSEESDYGYFLGRRKLRFKAQTRLWGYNLALPDQQDERTNLFVESEKIRDDIAGMADLNPVLAQRAWERQAEENVIQRMQQTGVIAPDGEVNKVLETVVTNLEVTNNLTFDPPVRARVLLTSPLESFTIGRTIVVSRGLIDVLPDEASLAMVLAHELAHIALDHHVNTKYAFHDRMLFDDAKTFRELVLKRDETEEAAADEKALELLNNSPYRDKLASAGLFLKALQHRAPQIPNLLRPHLGNYLAEGKVIRMKPLMDGAPELELARLDQIAALPLGGRVRVDPWDITARLVKAEPVALQSTREKMPFEVTPIFPFLTLQSVTNNKPQQQAGP